MALRARLLTRASGKPSPPAARKRNRLAKSRQEVFWPHPYRLWYIAFQGTRYRGVDRLENLLLPLAIACAGSLLLSGAACLWCALFSTPSQYVKRADRIEAALSDCASLVEAMEAKWLQYRTEMSGLAESVEGTLESVERKRRQISGAASRLNAGQVLSEPEPQTRDDVVRVARAKVYGGAS